MIDHLLDEHHMDIEAKREDFSTTIDCVDAGTPLNCAVYYRNLATVKHLLKRGAQPRDAADQSAGPYGFLPALGPLLDAGADPDHALKIVIQRNDVEAVRLCVKAGADPRAIISMQEVLAARRAARADLDSDDEEKEYDEEYPADDQRNTAWTDEMEALLRSFDHAS